jgi:rhodanese-related sulfurtransferase
MRRIGARLLLCFVTLSALADYKGELDQQQALDKIKAGKIAVVDVRTPEEFAEGHVPGAINISYDKMGERVREIPATKEQPVLLYCRSGKRAAMAETTLTAAGYSNLYHLKGDMQAWVENKQPIEK